jgi:hypothetical protein
MKHNSYLHGNTDVRRHVMQLSPNSVVYATENPLGNHLEKRYPLPLDCKVTMINPSRGSQGRAGLDIHIHYIHTQESKRKSADSRKSIPIRVQSSAYAARKLQVSPSLVSSKAT